MLLENSESSSFSKNQDRANIYILLGALILREMVERDYYFNRDASKRPALNSTSIV